MVMRRHITMATVEKREKMANQHTLTIVKSAFFFSFRSMCITVSVCYFARYDKLSGHLLMFELESDTVDAAAPGGEDVSQCLK